MEIAICIIVSVLLIAINAYFSLAEMSMVTARASRLQQAADEGVPGATRALEVAADTDRLFAAIQVGITIASFATSAVGATKIAEPITAWLCSFNISWLNECAGFISVACMTLLMAYFTLVFGELLPKRAAIVESEKVAIKIARSVQIVERCMRPLVSLMSASTAMFSKLFGIKDKGDSEKYSEEEIKIMVAEQDSLLDEEKRMIGEIFDLGDTVAREIMVPRVDVAMVEDTDTVKQAIGKIRGTGFSRLPVFREDRDKIVGIVMVKDMLSALLADKEQEPVTQYMRTDIKYVPETKDILPLLSEMQNEHQQLVIVVDEYGGTAGLITIEDILEEIVGEISDEYDPDRKFITRVGDNEWVLDGRLPVDDAIELGMKIEESDEYDTVAGWLMDTIDFIPTPGEEFELDNVKITVKQMRRKRISLLDVVIEQPEEVAGNDVDSSADDLNTTEE